MNAKKLPQLIKVTVRTHQKGDLTFYSCSACLKKYRKKENAITCGRQCKAKLLKQVGSAKSTSNLKVVAKTPSAKKEPPPQEAKKRNPPKVKLSAEDMQKFFKDGRKLVCKKCGNEFKSFEDVIKCYDGHPKEIPDSKKLEGDETSPEAKKRKPPKVKLSAEDKQKFFKDGRKLVCKKCGKEFSAFEDVIKCYDDHAEETSDSKKLEGDEKFSRDGAKYVCRNCSSKFFTRDEVIECYDSHDGKPAVKKNKEDSEEEKSDETPTPAPKVKLEGEEKFSRDGAKYICRNCKAKLFTRDEVIACFDAH